MGYLRVRAGSGISKTVSVSYELTGLTTTGATSASAYAPFTFVLSGAGNRIPPDSIKIWMGGAFLTQGVDYTYNKDTGSVTIRQVLDDILVEAVGKVATIIWSPAEGYNYFAIFRLSGSTGASLADGYYICWYNAKPSNGWKPANGWASWSLINSRGDAGANFSAGYHSQAFETLSGAIAALYIKNGATYTSGGFALARSSFSQFSGTTFSVYSPRSFEKANFSVTWYTLVQVHAYYGGSYQGGVHNDTFSSVQEPPSQITDYDVIKVQS